MQYFILLLLTTLFSVFHFTERPKILPPFMMFLPEVLAAVALLYVVISGSRTRFQNVRAEYWLVFGCIGALILCGIFANSVAPGPIFAGMRYYLRAIPLFFLPAVFAFSDKQIRTQLRYLTLICLVQLPLAVYERLHVIDQGRWSGDSVVGSTEDSSALSIILISAVCVLVAMHMRGFIGRKMTVALFFVMLLPTTINETKATLILLPIGLLLTMLIAAPPNRRLRVVFGASALMVVFFALFAPIYDYLERGNPYRVPITDFFLDPANFERYIDNHADAGSTHVARLDGIKVPLNFLVREPSQFAFGVGIGNASHSQLGEQFTGVYYVRFGRFELSNLSTFLLELGIAGTALVFVLYWMVFKDSLFVARMDPGLMGAIAAAWAGVAAMTVMCMPYKTSYVFPSLSFLFWYFSGLVAARRMQLVTQAREAAAAAAIPRIATKPATPGVPAPAPASVPAGATGRVRSPTRSPARSPARSN
jgi:hypothetical protein